MILRRLLPIVVVVVAAAGFLALKASRPAPPAVEARERVWRIETRPVAAGEARPTLVVYGRVEAPDRLRAASPVSGRILEVAVRDGQLVDAGTVLARLDPGDLQPRVERARAEVERERIRHHHDREAIVEERRLRDLAEASVERLSRLKKAQLGAESALDQAREALARARLALTQREQSLAEHPARLSQLQANLAEAERDAVLEILAARAPGVPVHATGTEALGAEVLFARGGHAPASDGHGHPHHHGTEYATWSHRGPARLDLDALKATSDRSVSGCLRLKGTVIAKDGSGWLVQRAGAGFDLTPVQCTQTEIVAIGLAGELNTSVLAKFVD